MTETRSTWFRDFLVIPLFVGLVVAAFSYGLPELAGRGRQLTCAIDGPTPVFSPSVLGGLSISVNGIPVSEFFTYRVRIRNTGSVSLKDVPVRLVFDAAPPVFSVLNVGHATTPRRGFGAIQDSSDASSTRRFVFGLLNPRDEDVITLVTTAGPRLDVRVDVAGLRVKRAGPAGPRRPPEASSWAFAVVAAIASLFTMLLRRR